ncbi:hypothetical protein EMIT0P291_370008 [Pseudomonas sp. IT-P291]
MHDLETFRARLERGVFSVPKLSPLAHTIWMMVSYVAVAALLIRQKSARSGQSLKTLENH